ncbi:hypothetical protein BX616_005660 [Lobosporangium transversale]|uniref:Uncharacterized protein n=1 Tax=Lobosporangium transversale TaxID=64571 RepID=A0A1Y2GVK4_9FUNG|nr:hypothetical protein BCR41DRAFT_348125 [Lobosporangium transversale]KAF9915648.1 hypothetical protein BX616_005660 [Lobosporangium transversale]ORZ26328.1 hypothetical protein BCR41DRAFT_348125 [Lobosporangium transversale]|eukprot:XP_021884093.1 hypothetical protein BCR41DRAFT_348125 [Lobosporangium transversale]
MQLHSCPSDSSPSTASSLHNESPCPQSTTPGSDSSPSLLDLSCELSSFHPTFPLFDTLFHHQSSKSNPNNNHNNNDAINANGRSSNGIKDTIIINSHNDNNNGNSGNTSSIINLGKCIIPGAPFKPALLNHSEPLDLSATEPSPTLEQRLVPVLEYLSPSCPATEVTPQVSSPDSTDNAVPSQDTGSGTAHNEHDERKEQTGDEALSEPQFHRGSDVDGLESPLLTQHSHIIYSTSTSSVMATAASISEAQNNAEAMVSSDSPLDHKHEHRHGLDHEQHNCPTQSDSNNININMFNVNISNNSSGSGSCEIVFCEETITSNYIITSYSNTAGSTLSNPVTTQEQTFSEIKSGGKLSSMAVRQYYSVTEEEDDDSGDELVESLAIGAERKKRTTSVESCDSFSSAKKRRKSKLSQHGLASQSTKNDFQRFVKKENNQGLMGASNKLTEKSFAFDASTLVLTWFQPQQGHANRKSRKLQRLRRSFHFRHSESDHDDSRNSAILTCTHRRDYVDSCHCRKRQFTNAFELFRPLSVASRMTDYYPEWIKSIKKRKIHQFPTKWTSSLSPSHYVKLLTLKDFWDVMDARQADSFSSSIYDLSAVSNLDSHANSIARGANESTECMTKAALGRSLRRKKIVRQYPCALSSIKGLWEEELRQQRERQMIPDSIRRPPRNKIFSSKPIPTSNTKPALPSLFTSTQGTSLGMSDSPRTSTNETSTSPSGMEGIGITATNQKIPQPTLSDLELSLKKKHRAAAIIRSHAIAEGSDMSEYKPWKDGTVTPSMGTLQELKASRSNIMNPWPIEESKARDECTRILHRMREQLNIVINLQIHLRTMIKSAPTQWSFLLSIRHPAQVSIELLLALYGPHFTQTSNFRAIEQLLWGAGPGTGMEAKSHSSSCQTSSSQLQVEASSTTETILQA